MTSGGEHGWISGPRETRTGSATEAISPAVGPVEGGAKGISGSDRTAEVLPEIAIGQADVLSVGLAGTIQLCAIVDPCRHGGDIRP
jgi:hypothetical protein